MRVGELRDHLATVGGTIMIVVTMIHKLLRPVMKNIWLFSTYLFLEKKSINLLSFVFEEIYICNDDCVDCLDKMFLI
jgi:hypothetical protein